MTHVVDGESLIRLRDGRKPFELVVALNRHTRPGAMRNPSERNEPRLEFLGEQDGPSERALKAVLEVELAKFSDVQRAYLARIGFAPQQKVGVALCLTPSTKRDDTIVHRVGKVFAEQFSGEAHLDIVFIDEDQEGDLRRVCSPFYGVPE